MKIIIALLCSLSILQFPAIGQITESGSESPYKTSLAVDGPIIAGAVGLNVLGLKLINDKKGLTVEELAAKDKSDVPGFDRFSAGYYSESIDKFSYYPFYASFAMPVAMLFTKNERSHAGQILAMYVETMAITGAAFTLTAGSINRSRPYTYGTKAPLEERMKKGAQRSFFAGHTAATASASFFAAKVFSDFNPDSRAKPYVWAAAAALPAVVGYCRLKGGNHFLSDNLLGYAVGAGAGILVPHLHKKTTGNNLSIVPVKTLEYDGLQLSYKF
ncbi:phosphatase PAP2 family protein [Desertivirga xinjiangensis]|uniref:phosphatase PAP2 family protein n=1 Tax=Desertivirga xinjiangensis TaxID=539206 RepID=UPI00210A7672|nr:phosphatase PAP2 family protein [Pedobacter xinjiangensis]